MHLILSLLPGLAASWAGPAPAAPASHAVWAGFRGDGSSSTRAADLPLRWSPDRGIAWKVGIPGYGQSSPVIWGESAFVTSVDGAGKESLRVHRVDLAEGKVSWTKSMNASMKGRNNPMMARAAPTPVVDADGIYAFFESGDLVAFSHSGADLWRLSLVEMGIEPKNNHGLGCSPAQTADRIILLIDHAGPCFLAAIDKKTGKMAWKADRPQRSSWTSPVATRVRDREVVFVSSAGAVDAYDAVTGSLLASQEGLTGNSIPSPTVIGSSVFIGAGENRMKPDLEASRRSNCRLELVEESGKFSFRKTWEGTKAISHHASPVTCGNQVYLIDKNGILFCLDRDTGKEVFSKRLPNHQWATPISANGKLFLFGKDGVTTILKAGPEWNLIANNRLWSEEDFQKRKDAEVLKAKEEEAKNPPRSPGPTGRPGRGGPGGGPPLPPAELEATRASAVGDVVYGVAAVSGCILIRTGSDLYCVRGEMENGKAGEK
ncbi:MAG: PQQ-binding-like beta-propeller repeat protein [Planctomycetota bacterium]|nr:PQQ-binding-like beta-propeller repeat protein [Planctomycetota bacterium]